MLKDITLGQYLPGESYLHKMDPRCKILVMILYMVALFMMNSLTGFAVLTASTLFIILLSRVPVRYFWRGLKPMIFIITLTVFLQIFMTPGEILWQWHFLKITYEGVRQAFLMAVRLIYLVSMTSILTLTTTPIALTDGIEKLLTPFKKIGVPAHELAMMMTIALRFIPLLIEEADKIMKAQAARGADFESGHLIERAKALIPILVPLFLSAFQRAEELALAMEARCYRGDEGRSHMKILVYTPYDYGAFAVGIMLLVVILAIRFM